MTPLRILACIPGLNRISFSVRSQDGRPRSITVREAAEAEERWRATLEEGRLNKNIGTGFFTTIKQFLSRVLYP